MMPSGTREYRTGAFNYNYENPEETRLFNGHVEFEQSALKNHTTTARTNFLSGGNTYDNSFTRARDRKLRLETRNYWHLSNERCFTGGMLVGRHVHRDNGSSGISGTFSREQTDMTRAILEAIYSTGTRVSSTTSSTARLPAPMGRRPKTKFSSIPISNGRFPAPATA